MMRDRVAVNAWTEREREKCLYWVHARTLCVAWVYQSFGHADMQWAVPLARTDIINIVRSFHGSWRDILWRPFDASFAL